MKKILFVLLLFIPFIVLAENCEVVTGTGQDIGDEIKCGTESFYVIEYSENQTRMLAKYNLFVGDKIDYFALDEQIHYDDYFYRVKNEMFDMCYDLAEEKGYNDTYFVYPMTDRENNNDQDFNFIGCRVYEHLEPEHVRQDERAVGTLLVNGKSQLPLYGITYMVPGWGYEAIHDDMYFENEYDANGNLILRNTVFKEYLDGYKDELLDQNILVKKVSFFVLSDVLDFVERSYGEEIEVELEYLDNSYNGIDPTPYVAKMDIKDYVGDNSWVYSTTYWLGSGFYISEDEHLHTGQGSEYNDFYISNEGFLCALGRGYCGYFDYPIGNGIRPVITVDNKNITYTLGDSASQNKPQEASHQVNPKTATGLILIFVVLGAASLATCFLVKKQELE